MKNYYTVFMNWYNLADSKQMVKKIFLTVRPKFKDRNMKTFVVVRSGNAVRLNISFEVLC